MGGFLRMANVLRMLKKTGPMPMTNIFFEYSQRWARGHLWLNLLHTTSYSLQTICKSNSKKDSRRAGNSPRKTVSPHLWLTYILPRLEADVAKTAAEKKWRKTQLFKSKLLWFKWELIKWLSLDKDRGSHVEKVTQLPNTSSKSVPTAKTPRD